MPIARSQLATKNLLSDACMGAFFLASFASFSGGQFTITVPYYAGYCSLVCLIGFPEFQRLNYKVIKE